MAQRVCIGVFDSGAGGLGVLFECLRLFARRCGIFIFRTRRMLPTGAGRNKRSPPMCGRGCEFSRRWALTPPSLRATRRLRHAWKRCAAPFPFPSSGRNPPSASQSARAVNMRSFSSRPARRSAPVSAPSSPAKEIASPSFPRPASPPPWSASSRKGSAFPFPTTSLGVRSTALFWAARTIRSSRMRSRRFTPLPSSTATPGTARRVLSLAGRDGQPPAGIFDHRKGGLTTNKRSAQECEPTTKNEVFFLNSPKIYNKLHDEHMFSTRFPSKTVIFSQMSENFFDFSQKKWS